LEDFWGVGKKQSIKIRYAKRLKLFGANLRRIRRAKDITQEQLAEESGVSLNSINIIEKGTLNTSVATLMAISDALGISPKDLFD
jgi:transcriptional regulator with XRE-family HTH domain